MDDSLGQAIEIWLDLSFGTDSQLRIVKCQCYKSSVHHLHHQFSSIPNSAAIRNPYPNLSLYCQSVCRERVQMLVKEQKVGLAVQIWSLLRYHYSGVNNKIAQSTGTSSPKVLRATNIIRLQHRDEQNSQIQTSTLHSKPILGIILSFALISGLGYLFTTRFSCPTPRVYAFSYAAAVYLTRIVYQLIVIRTKIVSWSYCSTRASATY